LKARSTPLEGVLLFDTEPSRDERGYFVRLFDQAALHEAGIDVAFPQWSAAFNERAGTLRGLHFNAPPHAEAKLVRVVSGAIYDVLVDVRPESATFGAWSGFELREDAPQTLYVPPGYAHGYQTLSDRCHVAYGISIPFIPEAARGIQAFDPALALPWPLPVAVMSARDRALPTLREYVVSRDQR
jgi:dTDP-4-dehydrorhamnose 3,5-epimerase